ncbi:hypothetical protein WMF30_18300 [Sorangium sp. So ce134]
MIRRTLPCCSAITLALLAGACFDEDTDPSGMRVTVQKWRADQACWATMTPDERVDPALLVPGDVCPDDAAPELAGGSDRVRVVIDYGDLEFSDGTTLPLPELTMRLDGVETPSGASFDDPPRQNHRAHFIAIFVAPAKEVTAMRLSVQAAQGFGREVRTAFKVTAPTVTIDVPSCAGTEACAQASGVGNIEVEVSIAGNVAEDVTVRRRLDGVLQQGEQTIRATTLDESGAGIRMRGTGFVSVPAARDGAEWTLVAEWRSSKAEATPITLIRPTVDVRVTPCPADPTAACEMIAGVGRATLEVAIPGRVASGVTFGSIVNNVLQEGSIPVQSSRDVNLQGGPGMFLTASVLVPAGPAGAPWDLVAQFAGFSYPARQVTLLARTPTIDIDQCPAGRCQTLTAGIDLAVVHVTVPATNAESVTLTSSIDDVLQQGSDRVDATILERRPGGSVATGTAFLKAPSARDGATWKIFAQLGEGRVQAPPIALKAPSIGAELTCDPMCVPTAGSTVGVKITAPEGSPGQASVSTTVNGAPDVANAIVNLTTVDASSKTISGILRLTVPDVADASWKIDAQVGRYVAPSIVRTIAAEP